MPFSKHKFFLPFLFLKDFFKISKIQNEKSNVVNCEKIAKLFRPCVLRVSFRSLVTNLEPKSKIWKFKISYFQNLTLQLDSEKAISKTYLFKIPIKFFFSFRTAILINKFLKISNFFILNSKQIILLIVIELWKNTEIVVLFLRLVNNINDIN